MIAGGAAAAVVLRRAPPTRNASSRRSERSLPAMMARERDATRSEANEVPGDTPMVDAIDVTTRGSYSYSSSESLLCTRTLRRACFYCWLAKNIQLHIIVGYVGG